MKKLILFTFLLLSINAIAQKGETQKAMTMIIQTPTNNVEESLDFYQSLEYKVISPKEPTLVTNGKAVIEINPDRFARAGVKVYAKAWASEIEFLKELTMVHKTDEGWVLNDLNGCWIYLIEGNMTPKVDFTETSFGATGNFMGLSLEASDMAKSAKIWETLGFKITMGDITKGFAVLSHDNGFSVSLMKPMSCPHLFFNPSMTFFNGEQNMAVIEKVRAAKIPIAEEITVFNKEGIVDNIIIRDPGGFGFFLFSD